MNSTLSGNGKKQEYQAGFAVLNAYKHLVVSARRAGLLSIQVAVCGLLFIFEGFSEEGLAGYYILNDSDGPEVIERIDPQIDFDTEQQEFIEGRSSTGCSVIWTGRVLAPETGEYTFYMTLRHSGILQLNGNPLTWRLSFKGGAEETVTGKAQLQAGASAPILVRYWSMRYHGKIKLEWEGPGIERQIIPSKALIADDWTHFDSPWQSYESPVSAILHHRPDALPTITRLSEKGRVISVEDIGVTTSLLEMRLDPIEPLKIRADSGSDRAWRRITWKPIDFMAQVPDEIVVRAESNILVHVTDPSIIYKTGGGSLNRVADDYYQIGFSKAGSYTISTGSQATQVLVVAPGLDFPINDAVIPIEVNKRIGGDLPVEPACAYDKVVTATYEHGAILGFAVDEQRKQAVWAARIFGIGEEAIGLVRIVQQGRPGSVLAQATMAGYRFWSTDAHIQEVLPDGRRRCLAQLCVYPFYRNIEWTFSMRSARSSFKDGNMSFSVLSDGSRSTIEENGFTEAIEDETGLRYGFIEVEVILPPDDDKWCFTSSPRQIAPLADGSFGGES